MGGWSEKKLREFRKRMESELRLRKWRRGEMGKERTIKEKENMRDSWMKTGRGRSNGTWWRLRKL